MQMKLLEVLACPKCFGELACAAKESGEDGEVLEGSLECAGCHEVYPIELGIPRFVPKENYASSFGYQWNLFKSEQIDSINGTSLSAERLYSETGWTKESLKGKWILDAGCGAGRFLDVISKTDCEAVGVDISSAIEAARKTLTGRKNVHFVQASIYELPFRPGAFDGIYCIGVLQHTPDPQKAMQALPRVLKPEGEIAVTIYERRRWTLLYSKYLIRPLTKRLNDRLLLGLIKAMMPVVFPITEVTFRIPGLGKFFKFAIPVANYVDEPSLTWRQRYHWAILDTFDMLAPQYDQPQTLQEAEHALSVSGIKELRRLGNPGLNLVGRKAAQTKSE
ncbi:MAG: methyltransferase domain-containing protein [Pyrinomonadaceae bacterium]|nr:methyltransferase domain-containing protein [Pyrinomonadaceae bacterium]